MPEPKGWKNQMEPGDEAGSMSAEAHSFEASSDADEAFGASAVGDAHLNEVSAADEAYAGSEDPDDLDAPVPESASGGYANWWI